MGGPLWAKKDLAAWSIPKGVIGPQEDALLAARREFFEETGFQVEGNFAPLGTFRQNSSKDLSVWTLEGDCDRSDIAVAEIDDGDAHSTPFVLGTASRSPSRATAWRSARPNALKQASVL